MIAGDPFGTRPIEPADEADIQRYAADGRLARTCHVPHPFPAGGGRHFCAWAAAGRSAGSRYAFSVRCDGGLAGVVILDAVDPARGDAELAYWIGVPFWGRGLATRAVRWAVRYAFLDLGLSTVRADCLAANAASLRVLAKNGFRETGRSIDDGVNDDKFQGEELCHLALSAADLPAGMR